MSAAQKCEHIYVDLRAHYDVFLCGNVSVHLLKF
jgi:hypothetical protein